MTTEQKMDALVRLEASIKQQIADAEYALGVDMAYEITLPLAKALSAITMAKFQISHLRLIRMSPGASIDPARDGAITFTCAGTVERQSRNAPAFHLDARRTVTVRRARVQDGAPSCGAGCSYFAIWSSVGRTGTRTGGTIPTGDSGVFGR